MDRLIVAAIDTPSPRATVQQLDAVTAMLPASALQPVVNLVLPDFNDELRKLAPLSKQLEESDIVHQLVHVPHQGAGSDIKPRHQSVR